MEIAGFRFIVIETWCKCAVQASNGLRCRPPFGSCLLLARCMHIRRDTTQYQWIYKMLHEAVHHFACNGKWPIDTIAHCMCAALHVTHNTDFIVWERIFRTNIVWNGRCQRYYSVLEKRSFRLILFLCKKQKEIKNNLESSARLRVCIGV